MLEVPYQRVADERVVVHDQNPIHHHPYFAPPLYFIRRSDGA
jgi:hypothetical protein